MLNSSLIRSLTNPKRQAEYGYHPIGFLWVLQELEVVKEFSNEFIGKFIEITGSTPLY
jgi:hypothetical protein